MNPRARLALLLTAGIFVSAATARGGSAEGRSRLGASAAQQNASAVPRLDGSKISADEIDAAVAKAVATRKVTGVGIAVLVKGKIEFVKGYGFRDAEKKLPMTPNSVGTAASLTKAAFAYLVMQLVQDGTIDLDKPVYQYLAKPLPEFPRYQDLAGDDRYKKITARMLLAHTSGLPNWRVLSDDKKLHIYFDPGSRFAYSGEGIDLLQLVVEAVTKHGMKELMVERVFRPLGMTRTSMTWERWFEDDFSNGYDEAGKSLGRQRRDRADAAGSMQTTVADYAKFLQAMMNGTGLHPETREMMLSPQVRIKTLHEFPTLSAETTNQNDAIRLSYGLAWGLYWTPYGKVFFKEGHDYGWQNYAVVFDQKKMGMLIMTNSDNGESMYDDLLRTIQGNTFTPVEWEQFGKSN